MTVTIPTTRRARLALIPFVAALLVAGWYGWTRLGRAARVDRIRNVVLISIDTCRADRLGCYGYTRRSTPHIDAVAKDGVTFDEALSPIPLTTPAHSSLFTGTYPPTHGVRLNNGAALSAANDTLAESLRDAGFQTAAFVGGYPLDAGFGLNQGFDTYDDRFTRRSETSSTQAERTAEEVATPAIAWLDQHAAQPFFLFLHFFDAHAPYEPPQPFASSFPDDPYAGEIAYVDSWIGRVVDRLRALKLDPTTLLVITADHGESLGEHGEASHGLLIYQATQRVPLIIRAPGAKARRFGGRVSLIDVMPTILDLAGVKRPARVQGESLRGPLEGAPAPETPRALYCESLTATQFGCASLNALLLGPWKYVRTPRPELYDLAHDAGERDDRIQAEPAQAALLRDRLEGLLGELESAGATGPGATNPDPDAVKRLQSLGYVGGGATPARSSADAGLEDPKDFLPIYERLERANGLFHADRLDEAERELTGIVADRARLVPAWEQLAKIALRKNKPQDAVRHYARVVEILSAPGTKGDLADAHFNLAFALREAGDDAAAIPHYEKALALKPDFVEAHNSLGLALARTGRLDRAVLEFEKALSIDPNHAQAHYNLGSAREAQGKSGEAVDQLERAVALKPDYAVALGHLAWIRATSPDPGRRNGVEAVALAERACAISRRSVATYLATLAAAYAESGRFDDAVAAAQEAEALARRTGEEALASETAARVGDYRAHRTYRTGVR